MIRPFTLITMLLAASSGAYLFAVKHRAQVLDDQLATTAHDTVLDEGRIRVLQAQWALEIDPTRLSQLAGKFTVLQPMKPMQLVTLTALRQILPPPGVAPPAANPAAPTPAAVPSLQVADAAPALPLPPPPMPSTIAAIPAAAARTTAAEPARPGRDTRPPQKLAEARRFYAQAPLQPEPLGATLIDARATVPAPISAPLYSGSVLGIADALAPPQPLAPGG